MITDIFHGVSMALADSVPGVSGGTIAFILGFYEHFLNAIHDFLGKDREKRKDAFFYLLRFAIGWAAGMIGAILLLSRIFEQHIHFLSSVFLGLTLGAIPFILKDEWKDLHKSVGNLLFTVLGAAIVAAITAMRNGNSIFHIQFQSLNLWQGLYLIVCGGLAVSAMLLPGISGSTLLLIFGVYVPAVDAVKEVLHLHLEYLPGVLALAAGVILGGILASNAIRSALQKHRSKTVFLILGLMIGSLYAIIMGPTTLNTPQAPLSFSNFKIIGFVLGILILIGLEWGKHKIAASKK